MHSGVDDHFPSAAQTLRFTVDRSLNKYPFSQEIQICTDKVVTDGGEEVEYRLFCRVKFDVGLPQSIAINIHKSSTGKSIDCIYYCIFTLLKDVLVRFTDA